MRAAWLSVALSLGLLWLVLGGALLCASHRHDTIEASP